MIDLEALLVRVRRSGERPVVLIDGRSGAGKTVLAKSLHAIWPSAQLVRLDDLYPGWDGLEAGSRMVAGQVLATSDPHWTRWDWTTDAAAESHPIDAAFPLIVEGVGALSRANRALATYGIWIERDADARRAAALARDGESFAPHWDRWAAHEHVFIERERPREVADEVVHR